jgi:hypothetical protein
VVFETRIIYLVLTRPSTVFIDQYKANLLSRDGSKALVSILAVLSQKDYDEKRDKESRLADLTYYMSRQIHDIENEERSSGTATKVDDHQNLNSACVSHACCALVKTFFKEKF